MCDIRSHGEFLVMGLTYLSHSLNSLRGVLLYREVYRVPSFGMIKRDTRSLDCSSYGALVGVLGCWEA